MLNSAPIPSLLALAVCDVDAWRVEQPARRESIHIGHGWEGTPSKVDTYVDYQEILARDDIDTVMIATSDHWHATMARDAMEAGKDVAVEKPIVRTVPDGRQLERPRARTGAFGDSFRFAVRRSRPRDAPGDNP